jgi:hypothetical protein
MSIAFGIRRAVLPSLLTLALAACSGPMTPPADVGADDTVSSIRPMRETQTANYPAPEDQTTRSSENVDTSLDNPNLAGVDSQPAEQAQQQTLPTIDGEPVSRLDQQQTASNQSDISEDGVNIDSALGVAPQEEKLATIDGEPVTHIEQNETGNRPVGLAEEQARDIAEGNTDQPVVDNIGMEQPVERQQKAANRNNNITFDAANTADEVTLPTRRRATDDETKVAFVPRFSNPEQVPESFGGLTSADRACRAELTKLGVRFRELEPISQGPSCGIPHPIEVTGFAGGIQLKPAAKLNCNMTRVFAKWVRNELVPSAQYRYFSGVKTIYQMSSYSCRKMNSRSNNPWSEHAKGNAIDIGKFVLKSGKEIDVRKKGFFAFREKGMLKAVRADSCKYFNTVLGPGDAYHGNHFHFDLRYRKSGYRHCSL